MPTKPSTTPDCSRRSGTGNAAANHLYYACFYAVSALLAANDLSSSKHSGVRSLFHQHFVRTGRFPRDMGVLYDHLFEIRQDGDYVDFVEIQESQVLPRIEQVRSFLAHARSLTG